VTLATPKRGRITPGKFGKFYYVQNRAFLGIFVRELVHKMTHFAVMNTDIQAFLNQLFTKQLYNVDRDTDIIEKLHTQR